MRHHLAQSNDPDSGACERFIGSVIRQSARGCGGRDPDEPQLFDGFVKPEAGAALCL